MAIARVQVKKNDNGTGTGATAIGSGQGWASSTSGNLVVVLCSSYGGGSSNVPTITDNLTSSYTTFLSSPPSASYRGTIFYLRNCPSGITTVTVTPTAICSILAVEYSGADTTAPADAVVAAFADQAAVTAYTSNSITTTGSADLLIGMAASTGGANVSFASSGAWATLLSFNNAGDGDDSYAQEQIGVAAGSYTATGTCTSTRVYSAVASFKAAAGGAAVEELRLATTGAGV